MSASAGPRGPFLAAVLGLLVCGPTAGNGAVAQALAVGAGAVEAPRELVLSDQARRFLVLQFRSFSTEFMGCMIGEIRDGVAVVDRIAPADVDPSQSTATWVTPRRTCEEAGWAGTVGQIHSHPAGTRCWYFFPATRVPSADGQAFLRTPYPLDAIMCGDRVVWIARDLQQHELALKGGPSGDQR